MIAYNNSVVLSTSTVLPLAVVITVSSPWFNDSYRERVTQVSSFNIALCLTQKSCYMQRNAEILSCPGSTICDPTFCIKLSPIILKLHRFRSRFYLFTLMCFHIYVLSNHFLDRSGKKNLDIVFSEIVCKST